MDEEYETISEEEDEDTDILDIIEEED